MIFRKVEHSLAMLLIIFKHSLRYLWVIGTLMVIQACAIYKGDNEKYLFHDYDIKRYDITQSFVCQVVTPKKVSWQARQAFQKAEKSFSQNIPLEEKVALYEKALESGETKALSRMLVLYEVYAASNKEAAEGSEYEDYMAEIINIHHKMLIEYNLPEGFSAYAKLKKDGKLLYKDDIKALNYTYHAAMLGDLDGLLMLGDHYMYVEGDYFKGKEVYECAAKQNNIRADLALAKAYEIFEENYPKSLQNHIKAAEKGAPQSLLYLRATFRDGLNGYDKDPDLAMCFHWFNEAFLLQSNQSLAGIRWSCPLPEHPELGKGDLPYDDERKLSIQKVEQEFNPTPVQRNQHMITPLTEMVKKEEQKQMSNNKLLRSLQVVKSKL